MPQLSSAPSPTPRPPACTACGAKMQLINVDPHESRFTNLDLWSYRCEACGQTASNFVAHKIDNKV